MKTDPITEPVNQKIDIKAPLKPGYESILTEEALAFVFALQNKFNATRIALLKEREKRQEKIDRGEFPDFLAATKTIRESEWTVTPLPEDL